MDVCLRGAHARERAIQACSGIHYIFLFVRELGWEANVIKGKFEIPPFPPRRLRIRKRQKLSREHTKYIHSACALSSLPSGEHLSRGLSSYSEIRGSWEYFICVCIYIRQEFGGITGVGPPKADTIRIAGIPMERYGSKISDNGKGWHSRRCYRAVHRVSKNRLEKCTHGPSDNICGRDSAQIRYM